MAISHFLTSMALFYGLYLWVWPLFKKKAWTWLVVLLFVNTIAAFSFEYYLSIGMSLAVGFALPYTNYDPYIVHYYFKDYTPIIASALIYAYLQILQLNKQLKEQETAQKNAELAYLTYQFNPHLLLNMLNCLYNRSNKVSAKLGEHIEHVSELMQYAIRIPRNNRVLLSDEIQYLRSYTEVFRLRFEPHFYVAFDMHGDPLQYEIAPLLLLPIFENAFKHGDFSNPLQPIKIALHLRGNQLHLRGENFISPSPANGLSGGGLVNLKKRLQLIYPRRFKLRVQQTAQHYSIHLFIDLQNDIQWHPPLSVASL